MDAAAWSLVSIAGYSVAGVLFVLAIILFYKLKILAVIGDLSGRTAAKQIQEIRDRNETTGHKFYKPDVFNVERGKLTEPVKSQEKLNRTENTGQTISEYSNRFPGKKQMKEAFVLAEETELLSENSTEILLESGTSVKEETTVLSVEGGLEYQEPSTKKTPGFKIIKDIKVTHSDETI